MIKQWLGWVNYALAGVATFLVVLGALYLLLRPSEIQVSDLPPPKTALPKNAFVQSKDDYHAIGEPLLSLQFSPISMQVPDIKKHLIYYGKNGRPDAVAEKTFLHFAFNGNKSVCSVLPGERLYIQYDRKQNPPQYVFSPGNRESSLWMEAKMEGAEAQVRVAMKGENDEVIQEPESCSNFSLTEKEFMRMGGNNWEIGKNRVDATLLARQKARWYGKDVFLEKHGGNEYEDIAGKHRIDFGDVDDIYSIYAGLNDAIVWVGDKWKVVKPGSDSLGKPMLIIKKIEDRLMNLELWDPEGKGKITLNLLKSSEPQAPVNVSQKFKFVGARTRTQFVFEIDGEKMLLSPFDWLLYSKDGWVKLESAEDIDAFVDRKNIGPLFVFDSVEKKEDHLTLQGTLFNTSRTDMQAVEIPLQQQSNTASNANPANANPANDRRTAARGDERTRVIKKTNKIVQRERIHRAVEDDDIEDDDE